MRITHFDLHLLPMQTRLPFRYGIATMTRVPQAFVRVRMEVDGREVCGVAADLLPPKWFTKIPEQDIETEIEEMQRVIQHALSVATSLSAKTPFELWRQIYTAQEAWGRAEKFPPLLAHFGTSLVERAMIEAFCRARSLSFGTLLRGDALGIRLDEIHPQLNEAPSFYLPKAPLSTVMARHTVGLLDPLTDADIAPDERLRDGLPQSLVESIKEYDLRHFKIKVSGALDKDLPRVRKIMSLLQLEAHPEFAFSIDGNEQFGSLAQFREFWAELQPGTGLELPRLLFVEQPVSRHLALDESVTETFAQWLDHPPCIIDESDAELTDTARAVRLGYSGTSHKNCKGVFKGLANRCLIEHHRKAEPGRSFIMSGEDLCTTGPVSLLQDLAVMASCGITSVERNGHHYHAGLSRFPKAVQELVLQHHPDLYRQTKVGWPSLTIEKGRVTLESINRAPFGVGFEMALEDIPSAPRFEACQVGRLNL